MAEKGRDIPPDVPPPHERQPAGVSVHVVKLTSIQKRDLDMLVEHRQRLAEERGGHRGQSGLDSGRQSYRLMSVIFIWLWYSLMQYGDSEHAYRLHRLMALRKIRIWASGKRKARSPYRNWLFCPDSLIIGSCLAHHC
jgi:hypothetical protein